MKLSIAAFAATVCLACIAARAEAPAESAESAYAESASDGASTDSETVVVVANRAPSPLAKVGNSVTVLDENDIRASQALIASDLLGQTPGITFSRTGGVGQPTSVFIRGAASDQTVVVVDGVVLNDPSLPGGGYDFENLLLGGTSRIEVLRGAQSTLYGSQAIGGVINIVTADPTKDTQGEASLEGGSHDTGYGSFNLGGKTDALSWRAAASYLGTGGIPAFDERLGGKRDDASQIGSASGQLRYGLTPDIELDLRGYYVQARTDFDGYDTPTGAFGDDNEYGKTDQAIGYAGINWLSADRQFKNRVAVQYTDSQTRNYDPDAPANLGSPSIETFYGVGRNIREEYEGTWSFSPAGQLVFGAQHEHSTIDTDTPAFDVTPMPLEQGVIIDSGYAQLQYEVLHGLTLTAGGRYDHHDVYGGHGTGQFAAAWALPDQATILRASFGQGFKAPSLYELYSNYGNRGLRPEIANSWDAGVERHVLEDRLVASATYFESHSRDLIDFFDCTTPSPLCATEPFGYYANIGRSTARGFELTTRFKANDQLSFEANYTFTDAEDRSVGSDTYDKLLPRRPKDAANATATYVWPFRLSTIAALRYAGPSYDDAANDIRLGGYVLLDLRASYPMTDRFEVYARVENLTDRHYETAYQYGMLGRSAYAGVRVRLF